MKNKNNNNQAVTKADFLMLLADLKKFVTKAELKKTEKSLRAEIKNGNRLLRQEMLKVEGRVENLEEGQQEIKKTLDNVQNTLDGFVGRVADLTTENIVGANQFQDHDLPAIALLRQLQAGKRISKLEKTVQQA